jgi:biopolymer transport protein ExbD
MSEITTLPDKKKIGSFRPVNRRSTRVDLTPMVDLGFLLITFFVFTTSMVEPKAMDLVEPNDGIVTPVKESATMTIIPGKDHRVYYYYGILDEGSTAKQIIKTDFKNIRELILDKKNSTAIGDLMYIIKPADDSTFGDSINLLDEMVICDIPKGHYAEVEISKAELEIVTRKE